jgi:hypothetical protein
MKSTFAFRDSLDGHCDLFTLVNSCVKTITPSHWNKAGKKEAMYLEVVRFRIDIRKPAAAFSITSVYSPNIRTVPQDGTRSDDDNVLP